jgi:hypothetical protein
MQRRLWLVVGILAAALAAGPAYAGSASTTAEGAPAPPSAPAQSDLSLLMSIRSLAVSPTPFAAPAEVERFQAPTGAGTSRWPSAMTPVRRGVYISVMPACIPGVDEPFWPGPRARRR